VVDVIDHALAVADTDQRLQHVDDVLARQVPSPVISSRPRRRLNFMRPTADRS
jgi:hypothetical protein